MMNIKHNPVFNTEQIIKFYGEKDGVDFKYVCTTDLRNSDMPADVFYRDAPHPKFGNRYMGLFVTSDDRVMITNADIVETFEFGCVENDDGELEYSESHHTYKTFENGNMIDGGREYVRTTKAADMFKVRDGEFIEYTDEELDDLKQKFGSNPF